MFQCAKCYINYKNENEIKGTTWGRYGDKNICSSCIDNRSKEHGKRICFLCFNDDRRVSACIDNKLYCDYCKEIKLNLEKELSEIRNESLIVRVEKLLNDKFENENLKEELATEQNTNLAMLENLKVLNEQKFNDRLEIALKEKDEEIDHLKIKLQELERKFESLETKYSKLIIEES